MSREIAFSAAVALATEQARRILRGLFPENESEVFEGQVIEDERFWLFFRNRKILIPKYPNGEIADNCAFAVGKHGMILTVKDNMDSKDELEQQVKGLSRYFAERDS
jgi:hypothetical protein